MSFDRLIHGWISVGIFIIELVSDQYRFWQSRKELFENFDKYQISPWGATHLTFEIRNEVIPDIFSLNFLSEISSKLYQWPGGGTHDIFGRGCATIKSLYRPFLEFLTKKLDPFRNFCA